MPWLRVGELHPQISRPEQFISDQLLAVTAQGNRVPGSSKLMSEETARRITRLRATAEAQDGIATFLGKGPPG